MYVCVSPISSICLDQSGWQKESSGERYTSSGRKRRKQEEERGEEENSNDMTIDFYYFPPSPPCRPVLLLAKAIGVHFNLKPVNPLAGETRTPEFLKINPQHTIPTIDDNGFVMWERPIMAYLVSKYAKNDCLYPRDARKRGIVDQMLYFDLGYLQENVMKTYMPIVFGRAATPSEENIESLEKSFVILNKYLEDNEFLAGDILTIADISIVVSVNLAVEAFSFDVGRYDNVAAWYDRCKNALEKFAFTEINQPGNEMVKQMYESNLSVDS